MTIFLCQVRNPNNKKGNHTVCLNSGHAGSVRKYIFLTPLLKTVPEHVILDLEDE